MAHVSASRGLKWLLLTLMAGCASKQPAPPSSSPLLVADAPAAPDSTTASWGGSPEPEEGTENTVSDIQGLDLEVPNRLMDPPIVKVQSLSEREDLLGRARLREDGRYVLVNAASTDLLTLDSALHDQLKLLLRNSHSPYSAAVALEPSTGRVLAIAEHSEAFPQLRGLAMRAVFPAASVFKVITTSALMQEGLTAEDTTCSHGGGNLISRAQLLDSDQDRECYTLAKALGKSANAIFAKLTFKYLSAEKLRRRAEAFRFNKPFAFPIRTDVSRAAFSGGPVMVAATGAGFGDVFLSPLHGAAIAGMAANGGVWRDPQLFEAQMERAPEGTVVMSPKEARDLTEMLEHTVEEGTARKVFGEQGALLKAVGKTGTLSDVSARTYSWFIGYAPKDAPRIAVAVVTVSEAGRKNPAAWFAREAMRYYLQDRGVQLAAP